MPIQDTHSSRFSFIRNIFKNLFIANFPKSYYLNSLTYFNKQKMFITKSFSGILYSLFQNKKFSSLRKKISDTYIETQGICVKELLLDKSKSLSDSKNCQKFIFENYNQAIFVLFILISVFSYKEKVSLFYRRGNVIYKMSIFYNDDTERWFFVDEKLSNQWIYRRVDEHYFVPYFDC